MVWLPVVLCTYVASFEVPAVLEMRVEGGVKEFVLVLDMYNHSYRS